MVAPNDLDVPAIRHREIASKHEAIVFICSKVSRPAAPFGGINSLSVASYGVKQFFQNGGNEAWIVRVANDGAAAGSVACWSRASASVTIR